MNEDLNASQPKQSVRHEQSIPERSDVNKSLWARLTVLFMERNTESLVSVVVPTYDRPDLLRDAVESILQQTYTAIEILVIDDHSPIPAEEALSSIKPTGGQIIQILRHEENKGANVARNTGIENASGDFIAFLDDDDKWDPTKIERQVTTFQESEDRVGVVYTGHRFIDNDGNTTSLHVSKVEGDVTKRLLCGARIAQFSNVMVQSDIVQQAGLPDERFPCWQDREWYVRLSQYCEFKSIPEPLVIRHSGDYDQISDNYIQKRDVAYPLFLEKYEPLAAEYGPLCKRKMVASLMEKLGKHALQQKRYREARRQLIRSTIHYPFTWGTYPYLLVSISGKPGYKVAKICKRAYERRKFSSTTGDV